jgi:hypothetical protein
LLSVLSCISSLSSDGSSIFLASLKASRQTVVVGQDCPHHNSIPRHRLGGDRPSEKTDSCRPAQQVEGWTTWCTTGGRFSMAAHSER